MIESLPIYLLVLLLKDELAFFFLTTFFLVGVGGVEGAGEASALVVGTGVDSSATTSRVEREERVERVELIEISAFCLEEDSNGVVWDGVLDQMK